MSNTEFETQFAEVSYLIDKNRVYIPSNELRQNILKDAEPLETIFEKSLEEMRIDRDMDAQIDILRGEANIAEPGDSIWKLGTARWITKLGVYPNNEYWYQQMYQGYKQGNWMHGVIDILPSFKEAVDKYRDLLNQPVGSRSYSEALEAWFGMMFFKGVSAEKMESIILSIYAATLDVRLIPIRGDLADAQLVFPGSEKIKPIQVSGKYISKLIGPDGQVILESTDKDGNKAERNLNALIQQEVKRKLLILGREI